MKLSCGARLYTARHHAHAVRCCAHTNRSSRVRANTWGQIESDSAPVEKTPFRSSQRNQQHCDGLDVDEIGSHAGPTAEVSQ